jgi:phosphonate transport system substrate-binding protein
MLAGAAAVFAAAPASLRARSRFSFALTPVFLDNDSVVIDALRDALAAATGFDIELVQRRTYQEVTGALLDGSVDAAWLCGYPYLQHAARLELLGVPLWRGRPLYRSYLIARRDDGAAGLEDLRGAIHAFSDPDSNSGYLVTASDLARLGERPDGFFARTIFTYGHRNVVRAVAGGLTRSGSVDGYVWETLAAMEPDLVAGTRVVARSELLGFPPMVSRSDRAGGAGIKRFREALLGMDATPEGRTALGLLQLDGFIPVERALFDGIAARVSALRRASP